jgi:hypothetical protein
LEGSDSREFPSWVDILSEGLNAWRGKTSWVSFVSLSLAIEIVRKSIFCFISAGTYALGLWGNARLLLLMKGFVLAVRYFLLYFDVMA